MKIRITRSVKLNRQILRSVVTKLMPISGPLIFIEETNPLMFQKEAFEWDDFFAECSEFRKSNFFDDDEFLVVLTELNNSANWFSAFSMSGEKTIFIHATDWENYMYSEPEFPIAYEVIANILQSLTYKELSSDFFKYVHNDAIGCVNDMCTWKTDITFKLRTGDICSDCLAVFSNFIHREYLEQAINIFESIRKSMVFNSAWQKPFTFEESLPFTVAITKRKLGTTLEPFRKMLMLIDHFDSIVRTAVLMLAGLTIRKEEIYQFLQERNLSGHPSLGSWVDALASLAKINIVDLPELQLPLDFANRVKSVVQIANENKITKIRNEKRGHGYIECQDSTYKELFTTCVIAVDKIEQLLSPLFYRYRYYHTISLKKIEGSKFEIKAHNLSGSNPAFSEELIVASFGNISELPIDDRFYLVSPNLGKWIDLDPYFIYGECNVCHHNRLLVYDGNYMLDPYIGHRFQVDPNEK